MLESPVYDIIFAGGGTTACVIAGRLAATDPSLKILVIESDASTLSYYDGKPSTYLNGRSAVVSCGRCVGGGSAVNLMIYARGAASDYDDWATFGNNGWSFNEILPFVKKLETFTPVADSPTTHGYSGPIQVSGGSLDVGNQFLDVARKYDPDRPLVDDNNDFVVANAYSPAYRYVDSVTGRRSDPASQYLYPHAENSNVTIMVGKRVKRVIIENGRAVGVEYVTDAAACQGASEVVSVKVKKLIVVSAGAFGSPTILERSGIGAASVLEKNNISVLVDLPGVGENYQDHVGGSTMFYASDETETMNDIWNNPEEYTAQLKEWEKNGTGKIAHNGIEAMVKVRPTEAQLTSIGPTLQRRWETFFQHSPDKPMAILLPVSGAPKYRSDVPPNRKILSSIYYILYPESMGSVHITSGEDVNAPLDLEPGYLSRVGDVAQFTLLYKMSRELIRRIPAYRGEAIARHPQFPAGSSAACKERDAPVPIDAPDIVYSDADDEAIVNFHRDRVTTMWHSLGTCAMKPRDQSGVVDARLNVYGVEGLKVADLSICPTNVGNNTTSTALLIGEKAAAIIAEDLGYTNYGRPENRAVSATPQRCVVA